MIWNNKFGGVFSVIISILHYLHLIKTVCCRMYLVAFRKCSWLWCFVLFIPKCINITAKLSTFFCFPSICVHEFINSYFSLFFPLSLNYTFRGHMLKEISSCLLFFCHGRWKRGESCNRKRIFLLFFVKAKC